MIVTLFYFCIFFFFSSRRRHTRFDCDWSSDVCSSDLEVTNSMRVAQEEIFGPVVSVIPFKDEDDLIKQANDTIYGLSAGIWTQNITRAHRFAKAIKAGVIWINTYNMFNAASPFGGYKQSGYGREMGKHALELYTNVKSVWVDLSGKPIGWFGK